MEFAFRKQIWARFVYFVYILFYSQTIFAASPTFNQEFIQVMNRLSSLGVISIDGKSLQELKSKAATTKVEIVSEIKFQNIVNTNEGAIRGGGFWSKNLNMIFLSEKHFLQENVIMNFKGVLLHEFFGILEVDDENFHNSALIYALIDLIDYSSKRPGLYNSNTFKIIVDQLNQMKTSPKNTKEWKVDITTSPLLTQTKFNTDQNNILSLSGGVTGVGGGGDGCVLDYVEFIYWELFYRLDQNLINAEQFNRFVLLISELDIEFSNNVETGNYILIDKHLRIPPELRCLIFMPIKIQ